MKTKATTPNKPITDLCGEAIALFRQKLALDAQLDLLKSRIVSYAGRNTTALVETKSGGKSWTHADGAGHTVRVSFLADSFPALAKDDDIESARIDAGKEFRNLFTEVKAYVPVTQFALRAHELLGGVDAERLITQVRKENSPRVNFVIEGGE